MHSRWHWMINKKIIQQSKKGYKVCSKTKFSWLTVVSFSTLSWIVMVEYPLWLSILELFHMHEPRLWCHWDLIHTCMWVKMEIHGQLQCSPMQSRKSLSNSRCVFRKACIQGWEQIMQSMLKTQQKLLQVFFRDFAGEHCIWLCIQNSLWKHDLDRTSY